MSELKRFEISLIDFEKGFFQKVESQEERKYFIDMDTHTIKDITDCEISITQKGKKILLSNNKLIFGLYGIVVALLLTVIFKMHS